MLSPRRPNYPVQVLGRPKSGQVNLKTSDRSNGKGRKSLVAANRQRAKWPRQMVQGVNSTANMSEGGRPQPSGTVLSGLQASNASRRTYTVAVQATPSASSKPEGGTKVDIGSRPGQNQDKPALDATKLDLPVLPGINQDTSGMGELPKPVLSADAPKASQKSEPPTMTVNKPLPGQNQENPIMGDVALPSAPTSLAPVFSQPPLTPFSSVSSVASESSVMTLSAPAIPMPTPATPPLVSFTPSSVTSLVTITRSAQEQLEAPVSIALASTPTAFRTTSNSFGADATGLPTTQAVAAAQSASILIASTATVARASSNPTASSNSQDGSILNPTARTLLIVFVILGVLSILVAIVISMMVKSHRRRSDGSQQHAENQLPYDASNVNAGVTTHISADPSENPFLTASEKAIINRAASPDGNPDISNSSRFTDAISAFIIKSRSLTYKISP